MNGNQETGALVGRLMGHYWAADDSPTARRAQLEDWVEDLREFDSDTVAEACREWRQMPASRRPVPGDIRAICLRLQREERSRRVDHSAGWMNRSERAIALARNEQQILRDGKRIGDEWAKTRGFAGLDAFAEANGMDYVAARVMVARSICGSSPYPLRIGTFRLLADAIGGR